MDLFDNALFAVATLLHESEDATQRGYAQRAAHLHALAESSAWRSGFLELVFLVWSYESPLAGE